MKLQRSTGILLGVAIALVTTVIIFETRQDTQSSENQTLYNFAEADISSFTLERDNETLSFTKTDNTWTMTEPESATADPASISFLLNIITSDTVKQTITTNTNQLETYGLDQPKAIVELTVDDESHRLVVGDEDFSGTSLYVMTNHDVVGQNPVDIYLIPKGLENGIERPVTDWIASDREAVNDVNDSTDNRQNEPSEESSTQESDNDQDIVAPADTVTP